MKIPSSFFLILRVALGCVFVVSGYQKLAKPAENFAEVIRKFEVLPADLVGVAAQAFPWAEFLLGVLFVLGLWRFVSGAALWAMNVGFIGLLSSALLRDLPIDECGCFGEAVHLSMKQMLLLDTLFFAGFLIFFVFGRRVKTHSLDDILGSHG